MSIRLRRSALEVVPSIADVRPPLPRSIAVVGATLDAPAGAFLSLLHQALEAHGAVETWRWGRSKEVEPDVVYFEDVDAVSCQQPRARFVLMYGAMFTARRAPTLSVLVTGGALRLRYDPFAREVEHLFGLTIEQPRAALATQLALQLARD